MKLTVVLIVGVALAIAAAMVLESVNGPEYARWYIYKNPWFAALLGILAVNVLAALIVRLFWRRGHRGVWLIHAGLLVLLAGAIVSFVSWRRRPTRLGRRRIGRHAPDERLQPTHDGLEWARKPTPIKVQL